MHNRRISTMLITLSILLVISLLATSLTFAQDEGLSDEEQALLDRVLALVDTTDDYESFVIDIFSSVTELQQLMVGPVAAQDSNTSLTIEANATVISGDKPNANITLTASYDNFAEAELASYTIEAEARYVDGELYINIISIGGSEGMPAPEAPEGWQLVDELYPFYEDLDLENFLDLLEVVELDEEEQADVEEILQTAASSVTLEESDIEGVPVDVITINIGAEGFLALMSQNMDMDNPIQAALMGMISDYVGEADDLVQYNIAINEDEMVVGLAVAINFVVEELDISSLDPSLAGALFNLSVENFEVIEFSQINESFEPVEAPIE